MHVLVTGAAGFIGFHVADRLLERGERVIGLDNVNDYYSVALKRDRLAELARRHGAGFAFVEADFFGEPRPSFGSALWLALRSPGCRRSGRKSTAGQGVPPATTWLRVALVGA